MTRQANMRSKRGNVGSDGRPDTRGGCSRGARLSRRMRGAGGPKAALRHLAASGFAAAARAAARSVLLAAFCWSRWTSHLCRDTQTTSLYLLCFTQNLPLIISWMLDTGTWRLNITKKWTYFYHVPNTVMSTFSKRFLNDSVICTKSKIKSSILICHL